MKVNKNYLNLQESYLFSTISKKVSEYKALYPQAQLISLGIGDVTRPLCSAVIEAMHVGIDEMSVKETFKGYGPEQGYTFLREAISHYYLERNTKVAPEEIFISDGAKSDLGNILDLFNTDNTVLIPDPVYPVYVDTNIMAGRKIEYIDGTKENDFLPMPSPHIQGDIIYLCSPNNPTGATYNYEQLKIWVDYALSREAIILFDAAYEAFVGDDALPRSIYEIEGARQCAIEFCSLSKTAGFTGTRCGYTVVPNELQYEGVKLHGLWLRRQTTKFNGVPYIVQKGAEAVFTPTGRSQVKENIDYYKENAKIITRTLKDLEISFTGGDNSPYIWMRCPEGISSWAYFDYLLDKAHIVGTPGVGFGKNGEGYFRLTAFGERTNIESAMARLRNLQKAI